MSFSAHEHEKIIASLSPHHKTKHTISNQLSTQGSKQLEIEFNTTWISTSLNQLLLVLYIIKNHLD